MNYLVGSMEGDPRVNAAILMPEQLRPQWLDGRLDQRTFALVKWNPVVDCSRNDAVRIIAEFVVRMP